MNQPVNVVCMKWGDKFGPEYVNNLRAMVARNLARPHRFVCFTDNPSGISAPTDCQPLPPCNVPHRPETEAWRKISPWRKVSLFSPQLGDLVGPTLFLDLDLLVTGSIDPLFDLPGEFCIIHNWTQRDRAVGNSSVFRFVAGAHPEIFNRYNADPDALANAYDNEQIYVSEMLAGRMVWWPDDWVRSFKRHAMPGGLLNWFVTPRLPPGCRILVFHGLPTPADAVRGIYRKRGKHVRPTPWILEYWHE